MYAVCKNLDKGKRGSFKRASFFSTLLLFYLGCEAQNSSAPTLQLDGLEYPPEKIVQFKLPGLLREISGLAVDASDRLFAHDDESGVIFLIDYEAGKITKRFQLGEKLVRDDFEGIAVSPEHIYLVTSSGTIYETVEGADAEVVSYIKYPANLDCEIEGLTHADANNELYAVCKNLDKGKRGIKIFRWSIAKHRYDSTPVFHLRRKQLLATGFKNYGPSAVTLLSTGRILLLASQQKAFILVDLANSSAEAIDFPLPRIHSQAEGLAITSDGNLLIADEGNNKKGRLSVYYRRR